MDFAKDLPIFFSDFARRIDLGGSIVEAVVEACGGVYSSQGAVEKCDVIVHVRTSDIPASMARQPGGSLVMEGRVWTVKDRSDDLGVTTISLIRGRGY